jgi:hypothetical protein
MTNQTVELSNKAPRIDSSSPKTWAKTWIDRMIFVFDSGHPAEITDALWYDLYIGDLPWTDPLGSQVYAAIKADPRWAPLEKRLFEREHSLPSRKRHNWRIL